MAPVLGFHLSVDCVEWVFLRMSPLLGFVVCFALLVLLTLGGLKAAVVPTIDGLHLAMYYTVLPIEETIVLLLPSPTKYDGRVLHFSLSDKELVPKI